MDKSAWIETAFISLAILLAYIWLNIPFLSPYSLQAFAVAALTYFILKRVNKAKIWHFLPSSAADEMALASFCFVLLIGATGNLHSIFFPLTYVHIFFLTLATKQKTAIVINLEILLVHYALSTELNLQLLSELLTLPIISIFFLFAKRQYDELKASKKQLALEDKQLHEYEAFVKKQAEEINELKKQRQAEREKLPLPEKDQDFLRSDLLPQLKQIKKLSQFQQNKTVIQTQLSLVLKKINKIVGK